MVRRERWGKLLYNKYWNFKVYENGIKPSPLHLTFVFVPWENITKIYKICLLGRFYIGIQFGSPHAPTLKSEVYNYEYGFATRFRNDRELKRVLGILRERLGNRWEEVYNENEVLCDVLCADHYKAKGYKIVEYRGKDFVLIRKSGD